MISKRGTSFGDFLRGLFVEVEPPEAIRQGRQNRPSSIPLSPPGKKEKHENINIDPDPSSKKNLSEDLPDDNVGYTNIGSGLVSGSSTAGVKNWNLSLFQMPLQLNITTTSNDTAGIMITENDKISEGLGTWNFDPSQMSLFDFPLEGGGVSKTLEGLGPPPGRSSSDESTRINPSSTISALSSVSTKNSPHTQSTRIPRKRRPTTRHGRAKVTTSTPSPPNITSQRRPVRPTRTGRAKITTTISPNNSRIRRPTSRGWAKPQPPFFSQKKLCMLDLIDFFFSRYFDSI